MSIRLDFDSSDARQLVHNAYTLAEEYQRPRINVDKRAHKLYNAVIDMSERDPERANIFIPKLWSIIKTKVPRDLRALGSNRPYFPLTTKRDEFKEFGRVWEDYIDDLAEKANWWLKLDLGALLKTTYGTSFVDVVPYWVPVKQSAMQIVNGRPVFVSQMVKQMRLRFQVWAPWEIFIDPAATNLEEPGGCRFVVKTQLASKREIVKLAEAGGYPGLDIQQLMDDKAGSTMSPDARHEGLKMVNSIGLPSSMLDGDLGVIFRYETPERYVDVWNGFIPLRDTSNPFLGQDGSGHSRINLARWVHEQDAHTQNQMWGIGEIKPGEILQEYLNDLHNMAADSHGLLNQPVIYYAKDSVNRNQLVRTMGNRVEVNTKGLGPIQNFIHESAGQTLPADHYRMMENVAAAMDQSAGQYDVGRGQPTEGDPTATELALRSDSEGSRHEANIKRGEKMFLNSIGGLILGVVDRYAMMDDIAEVVGVQRAQMAMMGTMSDVPGGFNFSFKGSDKVAKELTEQRNWKELAPVLNGMGNVSREFISRKLMEVYNVPETEIDAAVIPDQVMQMMEMMQAEQDFKQQMVLKGQPGGKYKENNTKQIGQDKARERTRA